MVANFVSNTVSVLLGIGDGTFGAKTDFVTGSYPSSVAIGDLNGDGKPDLVVANYVSNTVSVLLGIGDGTFGARSDFGAGGIPFSLAIADLNGDGKTDVVTANVSSNTVSVLLGTGTGTFGAKSDFSTGIRPESVAIGDLNGDGRPDLTTANEQANTVSVLLGDGNGSFTSRADFATGDSPRRVVIGNLNGDAYPDLVVANYNSNAVSVLLNTSGSVPTPTLVELFRAVSTEAGIRIEWQLSDPSAFRSIELQHSASETGEWSSVQRAPQVQGRVTSVLDDQAVAGETQWYRLNGVQRDGRAFTFGPISAVAYEAITAFALASPSPNPSAGRALISFATPAHGWVRLSLTDVLGREVAVLADGIREPGRYVASLDASDLRAGMYFIRMRAGGLNLTRRLVVVK